MNQQITDQFPVQSELADLMTHALERPAQEGARLVSLWWLSRLQVARARWEQAQSPAHPARPGEAVAPDPETEDAMEALHQARVSLRRLRATLKEYRALLEDVPGKRLQKHLRQLGRATNAARDADVQSAWLGAELANLPGQAQAEAREMLKGLAQNRGRLNRRVGQAFEKHFDPHLEALQRSLSRFTVHGLVGEPFVIEPFGAQVARRLDRSISRVQRAVASAHQISDQDPLHRTRIALKQVRAIMVPFLEQRPALDSLYDVATRGQDTLGAMRDAHLLSVRARSHRFEHLSRALEDVQLSHFNVFQSEWMEDGGTRALSGTGAARDALQSAGNAEPSADDDATRELSSVPLEIERKYLLRGCPPEAALVAATRIEQGWMPGKMLRERLRRATYPTGVVRHTRTVKIGRGVSRVEIEEDTERALFDALWPLTRHARVRKQRYAIRDGGFTWEVDVFSDRSLVLAEVELPSADVTPTLPAWLAAWVVRDVTDEARYYNSSLAQPDVNDAGDDGLDTTLPD